MSVSLTGELRDPALARAHARTVLASIDPDAADDVLIVVSELVSNAVVHGCDPILVTLTVAPTEVVVSVTDCGPKQPSPRHPDADAESGRGLRIVQRLTSHWYVESAESKKTVVAVVPLTDG